ncbi:MAG: aminopeptidase P N-terminal domain-containing protein [Gemmatimonadota bacterium]
MRRRLALVALLASLPLSASLIPAAVQAQAGSPAGAVPVATLQARRAALFARLGSGVAVLRSAEARSIEGDYPQDSDYREDNDFFYLTGLEEPGSWLVLIASDTLPDQAILYLPPRIPASERWTGVKLGPGDSATALTGIVETHAADSAQQLIRRSVGRARGGALYLKRGERQGKDEFLRGLVFGGFGSALTVKDLGAEIAALRLVKDADEIRRMRGTINATIDAHRDATRMLAPGMWEYQLETIIEAAFHRNGAERVGFPSIVGSGPNSVTLHYDKSRRQMQAGDLVVVDIGAEWGYYSADVTRTYPVSGRYTPRQRAIYDLVLATQQNAIDSVRPGMTMMRLGQIAREYMKAHSGDLCGDGGDCNKYFFHGLSHWLGMDVHDVGVYSTPFVPGMILTVEPGIYIAEENLGVRIEDDVLVTATGHEVLSAGAMRDAAEIERAMRRR